METKKENYLCSLGKYFVMACSEASDFGHSYNLVVRKLNVNSVRTMNYLTLVDSGIKNPNEYFKTKDLLMIDGSPFNCVKWMMEQHNFTKFKYLRIADLDFNKGKTN